MSKAKAVADGVVITVQPGSNGADPAIHPRLPARWLDVLAAGVNGTEVELLVGKRERPDVGRGTPIVIVCGGVIRCRVVAARLVHGVFGYMVLLHGVDVVKAVPVGIARDVLQTRWEDVFGKPPPNPITFPGTRPAWWREADEQPFPGWASAGFGPEEAEVAKSIVRSWNRSTSASPTASAPEAPSAPVASSPAPPPPRSKESASRPPKASAAPPRPVPAPSVQAPAPTPGTPPSPTGQRSLF